MVVEKGWQGEFNSYTRLQKKLNTWCVGVVVALKCTCQGDGAQPAIKKQNFLDKKTGWVRIPHTPKSPNIKWFYSIMVSMSACQAVGWSSILHRTAKNLICVGIQTGEGGRL